MPMKLMMPKVYDIEITKRNVCPPVDPDRLCIAVGCLLTAQGGVIEILRRYTDFVRLRNALKARYPVRCSSLEGSDGSARPLG